MADILIRMEMPESCGFCELRYFDGDADCCPFVGDACGYGTRHVDCPLIELPEHGDLIDRDANVAVIKKVMKASEGIERHMAEATLKVLNAAPVVLPSNKEETE